MIKHEICLTVGSVPKISVSSRSFIFCISYLKQNDFRWFSGPVVDMSATTPKF